MITSTPATLSVPIASAAIAWAPPIGDFVGADQFGGHEHQPD